MHGAPEQVFFRPSAERISFLSVGLRTQRAISSDHHLSCIRKSERPQRSHLVMPEAQEQPALYHRDFDVIYVNEDITVLELANLLQEVWTEFDRFNDLLLLTRSGLQYAKELFDAASRLTGMEMKLLSTLITIT